MRSSWQLIVSKIHLWICEPEYKLDLPETNGIDQFRYLKLQPKIIDVRTRLLGINPTNSVFIPQSLALRSIVLG